MCLGFPGRVLKVEGRRALVEISGVKKEVNIAFLREVRPGDWVMVHAGYALQRLGKVDVDELLLQGQGNR